MIEGAITKALVHATFACDTPKKKCALCRKRLYSSDRIVGPIGPEEIPNNAHPQEEIVYRYYHSHCYATFSAHPTRINRRRFRPRLTPADTAKTDCPFEPGKDADL